MMGEDSTGTESGHWFWPPESYERKGVGRVSRFRLLVLVCSALVVLGVMATPASAQDQWRRMAELFTSPNSATNSDFAFWGNHAFVGYYTGSTGGVRIFDISNPRRPQLVRNLRCNGNQNDPIIWDRDGNGVADLMLLAVDRTMDTRSCDSPVSNRTTPTGTVRFDENPNGWEGVRVFELSDNPNRPFRAIEQVSSVYTDCGAHTITAWTGRVESHNELIVYVSSYPLRPGPTCGVTGSGVTTPPHQNVNNPFDPDKVVNDALHRQIQVLRVPLNNPENTREIAAPTIVYPGDPDGKQDWTEKGLTGLEPAAVACHDIVTHMEHNLAGAACAEQGQVWEIDPETGIPNTEDPMIVGDDEVSSGGPNFPGTEPIDFFIPGAVDFFHSVMFNNEGTVVNWVDESFGTGCPTMTRYSDRPWNPGGGLEKTGSMFFSDMEGNFLSGFNVGDVRPRSELDPNTGNELEYCSAHMGMTVTGIEEDILVNAWYTGGVNVIDFTDPTNLEEIAYYDPAVISGTWSAYPYTGPLFRQGRQAGVPVYASDGVTNNANAKGMVVYRARIDEVPRRADLLDHLNPQTMDHGMMSEGG